MKYLSFDQQAITDFSPSFMDEMYEKGFVFTRLGRGIMQKTRSARIRLSQFEPSSENRRILKKTDGLGLTPIDLPLPDYKWSLGKMAKDFYETKFGPGIMSAQKIKEMLTDPGKSNFNKLFSFSFAPASEYPLGYAICFMTESLLHYSYPFYDLSKSPKDMGLGMMIRAVEFAEQNSLKYIYLGSLRRKEDVYKLQFSGLEWFDGEKWQTNLDEAKRIISTNKHENN